MQITGRTWLALFGLGVALMLVEPLLPVVSSVAILLFLAALLSLLLYPLAEQFEQRGIRSGFTVAGVLVLVAIVFLLLALQVLPLFATTIDGLARLVATLGPRLESALSGLPSAELLNLAGGLLGNLAEGFAGLAGQIGAMVWMLFILIVLVFGLVTNDAVRTWLLRFFVPTRYQARVAALTRALSAGLTRWFGAQLAISGYYIVAYAAVNMVLGVPFAIPIAVIAGLLEFIPYLGGVVGLVLSVLAAATVSNTVVLWVLITNVIIGSVCVYFVSPFFYSRAINVPVSAILFGLFAGGQLGGFFAALLTIPVVTIITILIRELRPLSDEAPDEAVS
ncbi:MAG: AI-2E family transporter [Chloroflexales bacterium]|nr:AI-2E family transporter [Chloroflexales bacterium]